MMQPNSLSEVAQLLRPVSKDVSNGRGKLCLSTVYLKKLNCAFDEVLPEDLTSSFHLTDAKLVLQRDLQFLLDLIKGTAALKIIPDVIESDDSYVVDLKRFKNVKTLDIYKIDVTNIIGIQRLRSQIEELTCMYNMEDLNDILAKCGGDLSSSNLWSELKKANFSHNRISDIGNSLELTLWLNRLDLSHNQLKSIEFINSLPNLKYLNISYNKLEKVPRFRGQICKRLQILLLNNNFIEDLSGLFGLSTLTQLDLSQNCVTDHQTLLALSHLQTLYFLNLEGNPIHFHPHHRTVTSNYLNKNTAALKFILDNKPLTKSEKSLAGSLYPISQSSLESSHNSSRISIDPSERMKRVTTVEIQDGVDDDSVRKKITPVSSPSRTKTEHLDVKIAIEQLRKEHGETWLTQQSGKKFQEVLGFQIEPVDKKNLGGVENSVVPRNGSSNQENLNSSTKTATSQEQTKTGETVLREKTDFHREVAVSIYDIQPEQTDDGKSSSNGEEKGECDGEFFFATCTPDSEDYDFTIRVTETSLSELDSLTQKEKTRWDLDVVKFCRPGKEPNEVQIVFDIMRSDKKSRTYYMDEADKFVKLVYDQMVKNKVPDQRIQYECLNCNEKFSQVKKTNVVMDKEIKCPKCKLSNKIIEIK